MIMEYDDIWSYYHHPIVGYTFPFMPMYCCSYLPFPDDMLEPGKEAPASFVKGLLPLGHFAVHLR